MTTESVMASTPRCPLTLPYTPAGIHTDRLVLRPLTATDLADRHAAYQKRKHVVRYLRWEVHDHDEPAKNLKRRLAMDQLTEAGDGVIYSVELPGENGSASRPVGEISVFLKSAIHAQFELGWVFHPAIHGKGFATEAAQALITLCFDTLGAHRVFAELDDRNEASARLCGLLGMRLEAVLREREFIDDEWHDMAIYALLADEYAKVTTLE